MASKKTSDSAITAGKFKKALHLGIDIQLVFAADDVERAAVVANPDRQGETPEALEGMGWVGHMLNEDRLTFDARERAYSLYLERGDKGSAARIAAWLAADCLLFRGEAAVANGWLQRAHSLIDGLEPGIDHGWLAIHEGHIAVALDEDTGKARRLAERAVELGRVFGAPELEMLGLGLEDRRLYDRRLYDRRFHDRRLRRRRGGGLGSSGVVLGLGGCSDREHL